MTDFAKRNIVLFFRDKASVFYSVLAVLITIGLYILFLGDILLGDELNALPGASAVSTSWLAAGLLTTASLTTSLGAIGIMIEDKARKIEKDFLSSPLPRKSQTGGYLLSTFAVGLTMTIIMLILCEVYILANDGTLLKPLALTKVLGLIVLSVLTSTSIVMFIVSFFNSQNAFAAVSTILGTLIGFLTGVYIPMGSLHDTMKTVIELFPLTHAASLLRQELMKEFMLEMFKDAPPEAFDEFQSFMGVVIEIGGREVKSYVSLIIVIITSAVFFMLALINMSRKRKS